MIGATFEKSIELFDRRFITNAYLPMVLATAGLTYVYLAGAMQVDNAMLAFKSLTPVSQGALLLAWLGASWFCAGMLWNSRYSITRVYEGYSLRAADGWRRQLFDRLCKRQRERARFYQAEERHRRYPVHAVDFLPTSFGNAMRASESYGAARYGLDLIVIWPRLAEIAPDRYRNDVDEARSEYEFLLCLSFLGGAFAVLSGGYLVLQGGPLNLYLAAVSTTVGLSYLSYRLAIFAAIAFGDQLRVVVDLYRYDVMDALGWPTPPDEMQERATWQEINAFLGQGESVPEGRPIGKPSFQRAPADDRRALVEDGQIAT